MARYEAELKGQLMAELRRLEPLALALRHEDVRTSGIPDVTFNAGGWTTWVEAKHDDDPASTREPVQGVQLWTCARLAATSRCVGVRWIGDPVVETRLLRFEHRRTRIIEAWPGAAHLEVLRWLARSHQLGDRS